LNFESATPHFVMSRQSSDCGDLPNLSSALQIGGCLLLCYNPKDSCTSQL
jgi:hypothetical protein